MSNTLKTLAVAGAVAASFTAHTATTASAMGKKSATACPWQVRTIAQPVLAQHAPVHPQWITKATHGHLLTQAHAKQWTFQVIAWGL